MDDDTASRLAYAVFLLATVWVITVGGVARYLREGPTAETVPGLVFGLAYLAAAVAVPTAHSLDERPGEEVGLFATTLTAVTALFLVAGGGLLLAGYRSLLTWWWTAVGAAGLAASLSIRYARS